MQKSMTFLALVLLTASCQQEDSLSSENSSIQKTRSARLSGQQNVSAFSKVERTNQRSKLNVQLYTTEGIPVKDVSLLRSNSVYKLHVESNGANDLEIRTCFGFEILDSEAKKTGNNFSADYTIKTMSDVTEPLFISFLPLVRTRGQIQFREQAQNFLLGK